LRRVWADAGRGHADAHVQLPCSKVLQRRSPKDGFEKAAVGGSLTTGRHKDICGVLSKWREVVKDGVAPDSCTAELVAFLQREKRRRGSASCSSLITEVQGVALQNEAAKVFWNKMISLG
jgi:hypothetical protein